MYSYPKLEQFLRVALRPIAPRKEFVQALKKRLLMGRRMKVEMEPDYKVQETITLATIGLGAIATVAAVTTLGVQLYHRSSAERARRAAEDVSAGRKAAAA